MLWYTIARSKESTLKSTDVAVIFTPSYLLGHFQQWAAVNHFVMPLGYSKK